MPVLEVKRAWEAGDVRGALELAVAAWRRTPDAEIAEVIDALDAAVAPSFEPPAARTQVAFQAAWLEMSRAPDASQTGWLARTLTRLLPSGPGGSTDRHQALTARVTALGARPDPRSAAAVMAIVTRAPYSLGSAAWDGTARVWVHPETNVYIALLEAIAASGDVRQADAIAALLAAPTATNSEVRSWLQAMLPEVEARLRAAPSALAPDARAEWAALIRAPRATPGDAEGPELLRRIQASPDDDALRLVYADWLQERGDPRGELIALQLRERAGDPSAAAQKRTAALLRRHKVEWLGELGRVLQGIEYRRGFLARAELAQNAVATPETWARAALDPQLSTVLELRMGRGNIEHYGAFVRSPAMRALRIIEVPTPRLLEEILDAREPRAIEQIDLARRPKRKLLARLAKAPALQRVRSISVRLRDGEIGPLLADLSGAGVLERLQSLRLWSPGVDDAGARELLGRWPEMPRTLESLAWGGAGLGSHELRRTPAGVVAVTCGWRAREAAALIPALPREVVEMRVEGADPALGSPEREALEAAAGLRGLRLTITDAEE